MFRKTVLKVLVLVLLVSLIAGCDSGEVTEAEDSTIYISIATGGTAGTYYPLGGALAKVFNDNIDGVIANAQSTGASTENVGLISEGEAEIAFIQNDITYYAYTGTEIFEGKDKVENMRGISMIYPELIQILATKESNITSVDDLRGKKVAVGAPGSGTEANARQVLEAHGITYDDLGKADYLSFNEAADQLRNKQIDAAFITAGIPTSAITEVAETSDIVMVPIEEGMIEKLIDEYPYYIQVDIPGGTYKSQEHNNPTVAVMAMLVVPEDLDEELAYNMTKAMFEHKQEIADSHNRGNDIQLETALAGMPIEVHPGAQRYYDENGITK